MSKMKQLFMEEEYDDVDYQEKLWVNSDAYHTLRKAGKTFGTSMVTITQKEHQSLRNDLNELRKILNKIKLEHLI